MPLKAKTPAARIFTCDQLSNEEYHADKEYISGSSLVEILRNPAKWKNRDRTEDENKKHLNFGTVGHTMMLEPERFNDTYFRLPKPEDFAKEGVIVLPTQAAMKSWLKDRGVAGRSTFKDNQDLELLIVNAVNSMPDEQMPVLFTLEERRVIDLAKEKKGEIVKADDYDTVYRMRDVLLNNPQFSPILTSGLPEVSIFTTLLGVKVKVRLDRLLNEMQIWDYKTTTDASPKWFSNHAGKLGYYMKMALQYEVFKKAYGVHPASINLLAQEKTSPFIAENFYLTDKSLAIGRIELKSALKSFQTCQKSGVWPSYGFGKPIPLDPPEYLQREFNVEEL